MREQVVRDQHGNPLPETGPGGTTVLGPGQVDEALAGLPGWERRGATLFRDFAVEPASFEALREGIRNAVGPDAEVMVEQAGDRATILLGVEPGDLTGADLEAAARIDRVLSGSATDHGSNRP
ncbi:MAG: hypothetical protein ACT4QF_02975 [Sporichthyaceae bacterium]